jgi:hypothetical protein
MLCVLSRFCDLTSPRVDDALLVFGLLYCPLSPPFFPLVVVDRISLVLFGSESKIWGSDPDAAPRLSKSFGPVARHPETID